MGKINNKERKVISLACAGWGFVLLSSGLIMNSMVLPTTTKINELEVIQRRVANNKSNEIKLKDIEVEINTPLSVDVKDYLENAKDIDDSMLKQLKLDISNVNIAEAGTYKYKITYNKKKYVGNCTVKEKELPKVDITLKNLKLPIGSALSTSLSTYITEELSDEIKNNIVLDLSKVSTSEAGTYQYTVTYDNKLYTAIIEVYQPQTKVITPNQTEEKEDESTNTNNNNTNDNQQNNNDQTTTEEQTNP